MTQVVPWAMRGAGEAYKNRRWKMMRFREKQMIVTDLAENLHPDDGHDRTTCTVCYEDYYGHPPENPEDYKYGKRYRIVKERE